MLRHVSACLICCIAASSALGGQPSFRWLSDPDDASITVRPSAISADGKVVVGNLEGRGATDVFRWTAGGGLATLPNPSTGGEFTGVDDVSADGSVVIGNTSEDAGDFPDIIRPVRWTMENNTELLTGIEIGVARELSGDGNVILGTTGTIRTSPRLPFRWTDEHGAEYLTDLCDGFVNASMADLNFDGSTIVGTLPDDGRFYGQPYSLSADGCADLDDSTFATVRTAVSDLSDDGSTIIGSENHGRWGLPFRWNAEDGYVVLSDNSVDDALSLTSDGSIVLGNQFIWSEADGFRTLIQFVTDELGVPARSLGITYLSGVDISGDGRTIVGFGDNSATGRRDGFVLTVPEPSAAMLALIAVAVAAVQRRYRRRPDSGYHQVRLGSQGQ